MLRSSDELLVAPPVEWSYVSLRRFASRYASTMLKAFKKRGLAENDSGLTGPIVMKEYSRLWVSKAECGSRNS